MSNNGPIGFALAHSPDLIKPRPEHTNGDIVILHTKETPKDIPYGDILLTPTKESVHCLLSFLHYYAMPEKKRGGLRVATKDEELEMAPPKTLVLPEINNWVQSLSEYINTDPFINLNRTMSFSSELLNKGKQDQLYRVIGGLQNEENLFFGLSFISRDLKSIDALVVSWQFRNPSFANKIQMDKIFEILHHKDCVDWGIGKTPFGEERE